MMANINDAHGQIRKIGDLLNLPGDSVVWFTRHKNVGVDEKGDLWLRLEGRTHLNKLPPLTHWVSCKYSDTGGFRLQKEQNLSPRKLTKLTGEVDASEWVRVQGWFW